ncbi:exodeoxyribonuclease V subunit alpha [Ramlibacter sp. 2FC]|uniref:exodeoxyribonuclease V subunit alpha n=1 Tax=Ramlibacter sp. 2FC TaxID=2502188 RepID=UPI0010F6E255|nr:exodeoxyribonuclease V subunit alpha [Ramlibacter sp. 2FC]
MTPPDQLPLPWLDQTPTPGAPWPWPAGPALPLSALDRAFAAFLQQRQPSADARHAWLAALTSHQMGRGHACLDLQGLAGEPGPLLGWEAPDLAALPARLAEAAASLPWARGEASPLVLADQRLYLRRAHEAEQAILAALRERLAQPCPVPAELPALLARLFPRAASGTGVDWQKVACALAARGRLTLVTGGPGTGKTTTVMRLLALLQSQARAHGETLRIHLAAPTGKAASRLGQSIASALTRLPEDMRPGIASEAVTLHRLLQITPDAGQRPVPVLASDLVVVDEASMIDLEMMARLLAAVPLSARLVLLGDKDQLASVEAGAVMAQLCEGAAQGRYRAETLDWLREQAGEDLTAWQEPREERGSALAQQTVMLRHSRRFAEGSGIALWAQAVNAGDLAAARRLWAGLPDWQVPAAGAAAQELTRLAPARLPDARFAQCLRQGWDQWLSGLAPLRSDPAVSCGDSEALALLRAFGAFQVLSALRSGAWGVDALNARIAQSLGLPEQDWYPGRPVMVTRNDYNLQLMNGDVGLCLPRAGGLRVAFATAGGGVRWVLPSRLDAVDTVFAMTVHKSQGSEFAHVMLVLPDRPSPVLTRELLYTGITRAMQRLTLVAPAPEVLWQAVQKRVLRSGGLAVHDQAAAPHKTRNTP